MLTGSDQSQPVPGAGGAPPAPHLTGEGPGEWLPAILPQVPKAGKSLLSSAKWEESWRPFHSFVELSLGGKGAEAPQSGSQAR